MKTLKVAAKELNIDSSTLRKFAIKHGIPMERIRDATTGNQQACAFNSDSFKKLQEVRENLGFSAENKIQSIPETSGVFYFIHLIPEFDRRRVKLGFTSDVRGRFQSHRCSAPTMEIADTWACKREWESAAIAAITNIDGVKHLGAEVFEFPDVDIALERANMFFHFFEQDISALPEDE